MSSKHYDVVIIGGSLAARIAAVLLAKRGSKVLFLRNRESTASAWFHSSLFLEKLLGTLGGRSCFVAQEPIQVLSRKARVTLNNDIPLDDELCREFGLDGPAISHWLERLRLQGVQLEELFWEHGGLPWPSFKTAARFKLLCMRRGVKWAELDAPVTKSLETLPLAATVFVMDLLQGLALKRTNELSRAQAALLWAQVLRPENLKEADFSELLSKRFDQFHGLKTDLEELECIDFNGSRWTGGRIKGGGQFTAAAFLLGDAQWVEHFKPGKIDALPSPHAVVKQTTSTLSGQLSPLLASRVICGGDMPLRLAIEDKDNQLCGQILSTGEATEEQLRQQLEPALPFAGYDVSTKEENLSPETMSAAAHQRLQLTSLPLRIGSNLYCADSSILLPEMGASGATLLAWTLAENLASKHKQGSK
ncbi:MAG: hypothetical protein IH613_04555 [Desulfuromonadales bacterium]|nr:hypothetical protein [Desulfuromonadales bacterium]